MALFGAGYVWTFRSRFNSLTPNPRLIRRHYSLLLVYTALCPVTDQVDVKCQFCGYISFINLLKRLWLFSNFKVSTFSEVLMEKANVLDNLYWALTWVVIVLDTCTKGMSPCHLMWYHPNLILLWYYNDKDKNVSGTAAEHKNTHIRTLWRFPGNLLFCDFDILP